MRNVWARDLAPTDTIEIINEVPNGLRVCE